MARYTKVHGTQGVYLLPSLTGGPGGDVYKRGGMEYAIASLPEIKQYVLRGIAQRALYKAQGILGVIRTAAFSYGDIRDHWVKLDLVMGRIDALLVLTDEKNGQKGALSIEYGRDPYYMYPSLDGSGFGKTGRYKVAAMTGKFILHKAFGVSPSALEGTGGGDIP